MLMGGPQAGPCIPVSQPLRILHGDGDLEVPAERSLRLLSAVASDDAQLVIVKVCFLLLSFFSSLSLPLYLSFFLLFSFLSPFPPCLWFRGYSLRNLAYI